MSRSDAVTGMLTASGAFPMCWQKRLAGIQTRFDRRKTSTTPIHRNWSQSTSPDNQGVEYFPHSSFRFSN